MTHTVASTPTTFQTNSREVEVRRRYPDEGLGREFQTNSREVEVAAARRHRTDCRSFQTNSREVEVGTRSTLCGVDPPVSDELS